MVNIVGGVFRVNDFKMCDEDLNLEDTCLLCNKVLINGASCTDHDDKLKQYECLFCDLNFSRQASLVWHLKTVHDYKLNTNSKKSPSGSEHNYYERPKCSKCTVELLNAYELERHSCGSSELQSPALEESSKVKKPVESLVRESNRLKKEVRLPVKELNKLKRPLESPVKESNRVKKEVRSQIKEFNKAKKPVTQLSKTKEAVESPLTHPSKGKEAVELPMIKTSKGKEAGESAVTQTSKTKEAVESAVTQSSKEKKPVKSSGTEANKASHVHCTTCNKDFVSNDEYHKHLSKYATRYRPFFCCICQTTFSRKRSLIFHLYIHKRSSEPDSKVSRLSDIPVPPRAYPYEPNPRIKKTPAKKEVEVDEPARKSAKKAAEDDGPSGKSARNSSEISNPVSTDVPQIIDVRNNAATSQKCVMCQKKFKKVLDLETHMIEWHKAPLMHKCSLCPEAFVLKPSLMNHAITHIF